ncbi:MAG: zinc-ribbon domain-containing protein [Gammaproteobacteria bacterium]|nr:zinc-ribbon domain-containing protein [Gammaproteobacteria bacterium]MDH4312397.1 zinc-ribbon domain-containing protein [Gammaproteobacteria bacterium]MDH5274584.1 zinc-ribbon domain-containing protein [Gammaproteobacteria bacterium]
MYSQCPECLTRFRVPAAALRAAHGTVRCGRCGSAFDAMARLSDTLEVDGPASTLGEPVSPDVTGAGNMEGATAVGLLSADEGGVPEFHFSADDIERVFVDARDWQNRFGASASPGDRAGLIGDTSTAELVGFLKEGETGEEVERDANDPKVWVHEPESVEDITLEGERIQIEKVEGFNGFEEDFLEREIEREIEEQHLAEITGSHRSLPASEVEVEVEVDAVDSSAPPLALDLTERSRVLRDVPESVFPRDLADDGRADSTSAVAAASVKSEPAVARAAEPIAPLQRMPAAVAAAAAAIAIESRASVAPPVARAQPAVAPPVAKAQPAPAPVATRWRRPPEPEPDDSFEIGDQDRDPADDLADTAVAGTPRWAWGIGALVMALLLTAQLAHHNRLQLARDATFGPALRGVYSRLGMPLPPNWNLAAFELRQWGANGSAPSSTTGAITVRASLKNGAAFAQPMPLLRLELEDRFGSTVARRDFRPAEYLKDPAQAKRLLPPGASTEAELEVVGTASEAVGYRLDVCLRDEDGVARCAEPAGTSRPSSQAPQ